MWPWNVCLSELFKFSQMLSIGGALYVLVSEKTTTKSWVMCFKVAKIYALYKSPVLIVTLPSGYCPDGVYPAADL